MKRRVVIVLFGFCLFLSLSLSLSAASADAAGAGGKKREAGPAPARRLWTVDEVLREALVYVPESATSQPTAIVFAYHGHGGTMQMSVMRYAFHKRWPDAIFVCPQGLNTPSKVSDPKGRKPGWQADIGKMEDRDVKFFDAMLASLREEYQVDEKRIYATGHSNGGAFTYLLWAMRGDVFAAVAPTAAAPGSSITSRLRPKPVLHLAGRTDKLVKFDRQQETMAFLREMNRCGEPTTWYNGEPWGQFCTVYAADSGTDVVTFIHRKGHEYPPLASDAIVKFFRDHPKQP